MATRDETRRQFSPANVPEYLNQVHQTGRRWVLVDCRVLPCGVLLLLLSPSPHLLVVSVMLDLLERDRETDRSTFPPTSHISSHLSQSRQTLSGLTPHLHPYTALLLLYLSCQSHIPYLLPYRQAASFCCLHVFPHQHRHLTLGISSFASNNPYYYQASSCFRQLGPVDPNPQKAATPTTPPTLAHCCPPCRARTSLSIFPSIASSPAPPSPLPPTTPVLPLRLLKAEPSRQLGMAT